MLHAFHRISESNDVILYCDLHGHSRKHNIFIYGCDQMDDPLTRLRSRVFPKMLSKNAPHLFSYKDSRFGVHKSKVRCSTIISPKYCYSVKLNFMADFCLTCTMPCNFNICPISTTNCIQCVLSILIMWVCLFPIILICCVVI